MANDIENTMSIRKEDAKKYVLNKDNEVDFNILIPMSDELDLPGEFSISNGVSIVDLAIEIYEYKETGNDSDLLKRIENNKRYGVNYPDNVEDLIKYEEEICKVYKDKSHPCYCERYVDLYTLGKQYIENEKKYGYPEWHSWSCNNWGVKWNAYDTKIEDINDDLYKITFITPWDPAIPWLRILANKCPYYLEWINEPLNNGDHGEIYCTGKEIAFNLLPNTLHDENHNEIDQENNPTIRFKDMCNKVIEWYNEE